MVISAVLAAPWLLGASEPWAWLLLAFWIILAALIRIIGIFREGYLNPIAARASLVCAGLFSLVLIQLLPWPAGIAAWLNPLGAEIHQTAHQIIQTQTSPSESNAPADNEALRFLPVSVSPAQTRRALWLLLTYALAFLALLSSISDREELETVAVVIVLNGLALATFAILQDIANARAIYGVYKPRLGGTFFGPFPNRNHFATWVNMACGCALGLILSATRHVFAPRHLSLRDRLALLSARRVNIIVILTYSTLLMVASVVLSLSRGGTLATLLAFAVLFTWYSKAQRRTGWGWWLAIAVCLLLAFVSWIGWQPVVRRLYTLTEMLDPLENTRFQMTLATLRVWASAPLLGWGFGTFQHVFPMFQPPPLRVGRFLYAHNDYAQLLAEGGLVGTIGFLGAVVLGLWAIERGYRRAAPESRLFIMGLSFGLIATAFQSLVDFGLRRPANGLLLVTVAALALAAPRLPGYGRSFMYEMGVTGLKLNIPLLGVTACLVILPFPLVREWIGELSFARLMDWHAQCGPTAALATRIEAARQIQTEVDLLKKVHPENPDIYLESTIALLKQVAQKELPAEWRIEFAQTAEEFARQGVLKAPSDYECWLWYARALRVQGKPLLWRSAIGRAHDLAPPGTEFRL